MSQPGPLVDLMVPAEILDAIATTPLPEPDCRVEQHECHWEALPTSSGPTVYRCALTWTDGAACDSVTIDPMPYRRAERLVRTGSHA